jgi:hypothetical protein
LLVTQFDDAQAFVRGGFGAAADGEFGVLLQQLEVTLHHVGYQADFHRMPALDTG